jgi:ATP-dependent helicase HepA
MERYLPAQVQTWCVGIDGIDYTEQVAALEIDSLKQRYDRNALRKVVAKNRESLEKLIDQSAGLAENTLPELVAMARATLDEEFNDARERLISLARVNPTVREEEIKALNERHQALLDALDGTHARPVSVRVMFNS